MEVQRETIDDDSLLKNLSQIAYCAVQIPFLVFGYASLVGAKYGASIGAISSVAYSVIISDYNNFGSNLAYGSGIGFAIVTIGGAFLVSQKLTATTIATVALVTAWFKYS